MSLIFKDYKIYFKNKNSTLTAMMNRKERIYIALYRIKKYYEKMFLKYLINKSTI